MIFRGSDTVVRRLTPADRLAVERRLDAEPVVRLALRCLVDETFALHGEVRNRGQAGGRQKVACRAAGDGSPEGRAAVQPRPVMRPADTPGEDDPPGEWGADESENGPWVVTRDGVLVDIGYRSGGGGVLATVSSDSVGRLLGGWLARRSATVMRLVTDRLSGERLMAGFVRAGGSVLLQRPQLLYWATEAPRLIEELPGLRAARPEEASTVARLGLAMDHEDVPVPECGRRRPTARHVALVRERIVAQRVFVIEEQRRVVFKADACFVGPRGAQVEGVYTIPRCRGRGLASRAMGWIVRRLLREAPFVSLHVAAANLPARRAYERAGFRFHSDHFLAVLASRGGRSGDPAARRRQRRP